MNTFKTILLYLAMVTVLMGEDDIGGLVSHYSREMTPGLPADSNSIFLSGKVVLNDGAVPPDHVLILLVCARATYAEGYTNSKGHFGFIAGQIPDRSAERAPMGLEGSMASDVSNCEIEASLAGFRSESLSLAGHHSMDNPDLGRIVLHPLANAEGYTISASSARAPKDAHKAFDKGMEEAKKLRNADAQREFQKAVDIYPKYASAWFELGRLSELAGRDDDARKDYAQAINADAKYLNPYERLYALGVKAEDWQEVAHASSQLLRLNPLKFPDAYYYNAVANVKLHRLDAAEQSARRAVQLEAKIRTPQADYVLGMILIQKRNFVEAAQYLHAFLNEAPGAPNAEMVRKQLADVDKFAAAAH
jgi:tetratricopeptide (TPR) repeat protein